MRLLIYVLLFSAVLQPAFPQKPIFISPSDRQHIFINNEVDCLEDSLNKFTLADVQSDQIGRSFLASREYYPRNHHLNSSYWFRIKITFTKPFQNGPALFEFFDQTTSLITAYIPDSAGHYYQSTSGASFNFDNRLYKHKNLEFLINKPIKGTHYYYFKVKSRNLVNVIIVYRTIDRFIGYALTEYFSYGIFYGMILIFCFHNLIMFLALRKPHHLFYVLYILSVGFYEMCTDGIAFQYVWPNMPAWNEYAYGIALYFVSLFALLFTRSLLQVKVKDYIFYRLINYLIVLRTAYFLFCLFVEPAFFIYKFVEFVPLTLAFVTGVRIWRNGFKPARFFVLGYAVLFVGFLFKAITVMGFSKVTAVFGFYSLGLSFIGEMALLSVAIGDQVRHLDREKDAAKDETIKQINLNNQLKDNINRELEEKVQIRTKEVIEKSNKLFEQAGIIEIQNHELLKINRQLESQAAAISIMNVLLEKDNTALKHNIEKVTDARVRAAEISFEEFSAQYPDNESCSKFLSELKWCDGYRCIKCSNITFSHGRAPYSRRCLKCNYEESVLYNTIFQNSRIPINKAFYLVYLMYTTKGMISSYQLSERIGIRQSTCWQYSIRIKKALDRLKKHNRKNEGQGWTTLILERRKLNFSHKIVNP